MKVYTPTVTEISINLPYHFTNNDKFYKKFICHIPQNYYQRQHQLQLQVISMYNIMLISVFYNNSGVHNVSFVFIYLFSENTTTKRTSKIYSYKFSCHWHIQRSIRRTRIYLFSESFQFNLVKY